MNTLDTFQEITSLADDDLLHVKRSTGANSDKKIARQNMLAQLTPGELISGCALDSPVITVTAVGGAIILLNIEKSGTGDIRFQFATGIQTLDCTPIATIALTAGTDTVPVLNYVYYLESTSALTVSTVGFPTSVEYAPVATVLCQSVASVLADGAYKVHAWTDHLLALLVI